ncbi:MAG: methionine--tRNA ligase, partial [Candidatus Cloacimonetes bacterium]|nr:methionine--tRNA ligase [Candidatus Cloacimonadota bacterium]
IDYTDDVIHIGHAYQKIVADVYARYHRVIGDKTFFLTGVDSHGGKVEHAAHEKGRDVAEYSDEIAEKDKEQQNSLNISYDRFIKTTDLDHIKIAQEFWQKVKVAGDIYLGDFTGLYCPGCEGYLTEKDLVNGKCPYHPTSQCQTLTEKNYFFTWHKYEDFLRNHIKNNPNFILPESRRNEMLSFLDEGLKDIPISRPTVKWGIPVPGDASQTTYVWFEALINYLTGGLQSGFWGEGVEIVHFLGKDNLRWHALLWPAMLKSAGYRLPTTIYAHGFISLNGQKISKSLGNIIRPKELVEQFGADAVRYYLLKVKNLADDGDLSLEKLKEIYNSDLANGLGNLVARVAKLCENLGLRFATKLLRSQENCYTPEYRRLFNEYRLNEALTFIWQKIAAADKFIDEEKPWEQLKSKNEKVKSKKLEEVLQKLVGEIREIAELLVPFMPETAEKIKARFAGPKIKSAPPLFPRI